MQDAGRQWLDAARSSPSTASLRPPSTSMMIFASSEETGTAFLLRGDGGDRQPARREHPAESCLSFQRLRYELQTKADKALE